MEGLKPCPKCKSDNGHAVIRRHRHSSLLVGIAYTDYGVRCDDCGYEIKGYMTEGSAIKAWNRRVGEQEMIIEARCCDCGKRIGYISIQGDTEGLEDTKYVKKVTYMSTAFTILCDECRDGRIDLEGEQK